MRIAPYALLKAMNIRITCLKTGHEQSLFRRDQLIQVVGGVLDLTDGKFRAHNTTSMAYVTIDVVINQQTDAIPMYAG